MSLLYECINGIVQGDILDGEDSHGEKEEIAYLCVAKLRSMVVAEADPNLKYVGLLAFNRIAVSHPALVSMQQDAILNCLEDADISIRLLALELSAKMVDSNTLQPVVNRLIGQLCGTSFSIQKHSMDVEKLTAVNSTTLPEYSDPKEHNSKYHQQGCVSSLPVDYRIEVLHRILDLCSSNNYSELPDFEWYVEVLVQLVKLLPSDVRDYLQPTAHEEPMREFKTDIASRIGSEIRNVAVRVQNVRMKATRVAETLVLVDNREVWLPVNSSNGILGPLAWVVGEYAEYLLYPSRALECLIDISNVSLPARTLSLYIQAIPKVFIHAYSTQSWDLTKKTEATLLLTRVIEFLEALSAHPDLDVQERAIEFLEVLRLAAEAIQSSTYQEEIPFLLSAVIPSLFSGLQLNPVAANAQKKVPLPARLFLEKTLVGNLPSLFRCDDWADDLQCQDPSKHFYYVREVPISETGNTEFAQLNIQGASYQDPGGLFGDGGVIKRKAERAERNKDDPFYIGVEERPFGMVTPLHEAPNTIHGEEINIDAIPVVDLKLDDPGVNPMGPLADYVSNTKNTSRFKKHHVIADETIGYEGPSSTSVGVEDIDRLGKSKNPLLQVDSSGLGHFPLEEGNAPEPDAPQYLARAGGDEAEMARAMYKVEKARLEMQRASERTYLGGVPAEGMLVSKKKKGKKPVTQAITSDQGGGYS
ncbi:AP-3 complex subunit delta [Aspergillus sclerotialis]|uniref:AP-3 complex subunit delta n=1 Tax=Aspergillus sclerotialis TaxID=2070753 RepID=A0A3A2ZLX9_9EURO|nr:AP-3 complex subunit delta [Aspergillus sclerotialis]